MTCQLTSRSFCPGRREAEIRVTWTMKYDPDPEICTSLLCQKCFDGRPPFIKVIETRPVKEGDRCSV